MTLSGHNKKSHMSHSVTVTLKNLLYITPSYLVLVLMLHMISKVIISINNIIKVHLIFFLLPLIVPNNFNVIIECSKKYENFPIIVLG